MSQSLSLLAEKYESMSESSYKPVQSNSESESYSTPGGVIVWYKKGTYEYDPANKSNYYQKGVLHNIEGPAILYPDTQYEFYINGKYCTPEEFDLIKLMHDKKKNHGIDLDITEEQASETLSITGRNSESIQLKTSFGTIVWYKKGTIKHFDSHYYYEDRGMLHNVEGPAVIFPHMFTDEGKYEYWLDGNRLPSKTEFDIALIARDKKKEHGIDLDITESVLNEFDFGSGGEISGGDVFENDEPKTKVDGLTFEYHNILNPAVWSGHTMLPAIKDKLLEIAHAFIEYVKIDLDIEDIVLTGSLANYNYTKYSDFDLHIVTDCNQYNTPADLLKDYFNAKKTVWNLTHDIKIRGYKVELYIQEESEPHYASGVYSLKNDKWIVEPHPNRGLSDIDKKEIQQKKQAMLDIIDFALSPECSAEGAEKAKVQFMSYRKIGLEKGGELSPENLAFKELRRTGDIDRLMKGIASKKDKTLSLDSVKIENFKAFSSFMHKRGPRHQQPLAGMNRLGQTEKPIGIVAQMHKPKKGDTLPVHQMKQQASGLSPIPTAKAQQIIATYNLDINKIKNGEPRQLSTSGIEIGFNPMTNMFFLRKYNTQ